MTTKLLVHPELHVLQEGEDGYAAAWKHLKFLVSVQLELDGKRWLHASVSRSNRGLPTYQDLKDLKRLCIGDDKTALQVFPPLAKHVNFAPVTGIEVLHLWACLDGDVTPDFTRGGNTI